MTATVVLQSASRARWLKRRRAGITATDVPALFGLSPWKTPLNVWLDKVAPVESEPSFAMLRGRALEPILADEYARRTGAIVERPPLLLAHPEHPLCLASLDRLAHTPDTTHLVEFKTENDSDRAREWWDGETPDQYAVQVLWQLLVTGLPYGVIFADVLGRFETRRIDRDDPAWEAEVIAYVTDWWTRHVVGNTPPPLHPDRDYPLLNRVWSPVPAEEVEATDAVMGAVKAYAALRERAKEREKTMTGLKTQIRAHMRTAAVLTHPETGRKVASVDSRGALRVTYKPEPTTEETAA